MEIALQHNVEPQAGALGFAKSNGSVNRLLGATVRGDPMDVTVENIVKRFGTTPALHGVSLDIAGGELIALLGPSGSGKTTLLRILAGLDQPSSGRILFGREDASHRSVQERNIGFVFQSYALFKHMTVFDNIAFGLNVRPSSRRPSAKSIRERVLTLLDLVQLSGLEHRFPSQLSGGQRQRVALARALAIEPKILLLDEPFGALDAKVRKELRRWLREIHDRTGHTTVFVTHDQEEALELADRVVVIGKGRIEQVGTADDILDRPATPFVFDFIGESSHLPVTVNNGRVLFEGIAIDAPAANRPEGAATLFFRPHHAELAHGTGVLTGRVSAQRRHGSHRRLEIEIGAARHRVEIDVAPDTNIPLRSEVSVKLTQATLYPAA